jgi:hypothetical protein
VQKKSIFSVTLAMLVGVIGAVMSASAADGPVTWSVVGPESRWIDVATSQDGAIVYVASVLGLQNNRTIFKSADGGSTWANTQAPALDWAAVDASPDGRVVTAVGKTPQIQPASLVTPDGNNTIRSTDGGATWSVLETVTATITATDLETVSTTITATDLVASDDGQIIIVAYDDGSVRYSSNGGVTFSSVSINSDPGVSQMVQLAMSATGSVVYATIQANFVYRSLDQGATWARIDALGTTNWEYWNSVSGSDDGQIVVVSASAFGTDPGVFKISRDFGATWTSITTVSATFTDGQSTYVAMSHDGRVMVAGSYDSVPQASIDYGVTWFAYDGPDGLNNTKNQAVLSAAVSSDGTRMYLSCEFAASGDIPILRGVVDLPVLQTPTTTTATASPTTLPSIVTTVKKTTKADVLPATGDSSSQMLLLLASMFVIVGVGIRLRRTTRP